MNIILFSNNKRISHYVSTLVSQCGAKCLEIKELSWLFMDPFAQTHFSGAIIDIHSAIKARMGDREILQTIEDIYPSVRLRLTGDHLRVLSRMPSCDGPLCIGKFIKEQCSKFPCRPVRSNDRFQKNLTVLVSQDELDPGESTITLNVSKSGAFLFTAKRFTPGQRVFLHFLDLDDPRPIEAEVRWTVPWGAGYEATPGIGVCFINPRPEQIRDLMGLVIGGKRKVRPKQKIRAVQGG